MTLQRYWQLCSAARFTRSDPETCHVLVPVIAPDTDLVHSTIEFSHELLMSMGPSVTNVLLHSGTFHHTPTGYVMVKSYQRSR